MPLGDREWMLGAWCRGKWRTGEYDSDNRGGRQEEQAKLSCAPCTVRQECASYHVRDIDSSPPMGVVVCGIPIKDSRDRDWVRQVNRLVYIANGSERDE